MFSNLRFLMLSHNQIVSVENLLHLKHLQMLDLSHNAVEHLDPGTQKSGILASSVATFECN